jgi:hypothetical protein
MDLAAQLAKKKQALQKTRTKVTDKQGRVYIEGEEEQSGQLSSAGFIVSENPTEADEGGESVETEFVEGASAEQVQQRLAWSNQRAKFYEANGLACRTRGEAKV